MAATAPLHRLHLDIDARVAAVRDGRPDWPCAKGCDRCCRSLADLPRLTPPEWTLLREGLAALPAAQLEAIGCRIAALAAAPAPPLTCPLLDAASGACPVYPQRPVACRSYGFYAQRELGLYCGEIEAEVAAGALADVVWGNHDAIDRSLATLGEARTLTDWFVEWAAEAPGPSAAGAPQPADPPG
ncbi:MAG: YkgJ family cysteine cluster protein [Thauera phenolivorans]|uniref:YkgJ family cysteine cluster protein n=1 Tax=Thauera phenolivorans TaxID=1792543 RepID=A0A7X7R8T9_9RHOO|nr:YkgJ family cysteine cluster protein [Thauera phenolivorans]NLF55122.1 YkgJ family cysteine cluster protein [Thauera phenolivorans]